MPISIPTLALARRYTNKKIEDIQIESEGLPSVTASDNGKTLVVENGDWSVGNVNLGYYETTETSVLFNDDIVATQLPIQSSTPTYCYVLPSDVSLSDYESILVTLDNGETVAIPYTGDGWFGGDSVNGPDFANYPASVQQSSDGGYSVYTQTQNYHLTIAADSTNMTITPEFSAAVELAVGQAAGQTGIADWDAQSDAAGYIDNKPYITRYKNESTGTVITGAVVEGLLTNIASGPYSHAEGGNYVEDDGDGYSVSYPTRATAVGSHAEGVSTTASGDYSHAEGGSTTAGGYYSHAEGYNTTASGSNSHAEGSQTTASERCSHAEGYSTTASGMQSHAEGNYTTASGAYSHVEGNNTISNHLCQHVFGRYNIADQSTAGASERGTYVEIVGNGTTNARSNARTLDWDGNEVLAGGLTVGAAGITIGSTTITESQLQALLAMLNS